VASNRGRSSSGGGNFEVVAVAGSEVEEAAAVVEAAVDEVEVVEVVDDDASWRFEHVGNRKRINMETRPIQRQRCNNSRILVRRPDRRHLSALPLLACCFLLTSTATARDIVGTSSIPISCGSIEGLGSGGTHRRYGRAFLDSRRRCQGDSLVGRSGCR